MRSRLNLAGRGGRRLWLGGAAAAIAVFAPCLATRARAQPRFESNDLRIGQSSALSGALSLPAAEFNGAAHGLIDQVNRQGGVNGRRVALVTRDDGYVPAATVKNVREFIETDKVLALFGVLGVGNVAAALPVATEARVPFLFPMNGDAAIRQNPSRYFFTATASFEDEVDKLVDHLKTIGVVDISVAHLSTPFGLSIRDAVQRAMLSRGLSAKSAVSFGMEPDSVRRAATEVAAKRPAAVIVGAVALNAVEFIRAFKATGSAAQLCTFSSAGADLIIKQLGPLSTGTVITQVVPFPWTPTIPVVREYQAVCKTRGVSSYSHLGLWGHLSARVLVEALTRAGRDPTREKLVDALEAMRRVDLGSYFVDFAPGKHHGSKFVDITLIGREGRLIK